MADTKKKPKKRSHGFPETIYVDEPAGTLDEYTGYSTLDDAEGIDNAIFGVYKFEKVVKVKIETKQTVFDVEEEG